MAVAVGLNVREREQAGAPQFPAGDIGVTGAVLESERAPPGIPVRMDGETDLRLFGELNTKFRGPYCLRGLFQNAEPTGATVYGVRVVNRQVYGAQPARLEAGPPNIAPQLLPPLIPAGVLSGTDPSYGILVNPGDPLAIQFRATDANTEDVLAITVSVVGGTVTPAVLGFTDTFPLVDPAPGGSMHGVTLAGTASGTGNVLLDVTVVDGDGGTDSITVLVEAGTFPLAFAASSFGGTAVFGEGESPDTGKQGETFLTSAAGANPNLATLVYNADGSLNYAALVSSSAGVRGAVAAFPDETAAVVGEFVTGALFPASPSGNITRTTAVPGNRAAFYARTAADRRFLWVRHLDTGGTLTRAWSAAALGDGTNLVAGVFEGAASFPTTGAPVVLTAPAGSLAFFLARVAGSDGLALWAVQFPFLGPDSAADPFPPAVAALAAGDSVVGWTERTPTVPIGNPRGRATLRDGNGVTVWDFAVSHTAAPFAGSEVQSAGVYSDGSAVLGGTIHAGSYQFPTAGPPVLVTTIGRSDAFVARIDAAGATQWVVQAGSPGESARTTAVAALADGGVLAVISFQGSISLNTGFGSLVVTAPGASESAVVVRFGSSGLAVWAKRFAGP